MRQFLKIMLAREGYDVTLASSGEEALELLAAQEFDLVLTDLRMGDVGGMEVLSQAKKVHPETQVVVMTAYASTETAIQAMKEGAYDYVMKPFKNDELKELVKRALEKRRLLVDNMELRRQIHSRYGMENVVGNSAAMARVYDMVRRVAPTRSNILILGESGTGKELVARAIHYNSPRAGRPMISVNCGAIPESLIESELFGHVKGAFTGAVSSHKGYFEEADGSTLFLDEIGELSMAMQVKLLRVLQERKVKPVGGSRERPVDVRLICATNRNLEEEVKAERFRGDLYYRINVIQIRIPPLRERPEDIPLLAVHFVERFCRDNGREPMVITRRALDALSRYPFPGNVRELENIMERAVTLATGRTIDVDLLPEPLAAYGAAAPHSTTSPASEVSLPEGGLDLDRHMETVERDLIVQALRRAGGVRKEAARLLNISFRSMRYRLDKYGIDDDEIERILSDAADMA